MSQKPLKPVEKTSVENPFRLMTSEGRNSIYGDEARGQQSFVQSDTLPTQCPRSDLEKLGFVFGERQDDLFTFVTFPEGWQKVATDHSMWSDLVDGQGCKRGQIFYKAAFYDRSANCSLNRRYNYNTDYVGDDSKKIIVKDTSTGAVLWSTPEYPRGDYKRDDVEMGKAKAWLTEKFPQWQDVTAYWDAE